MSLFYKIQSCLLRLLGDTQWFGWHHPFWFSFGAHGYQLKGEHYRIVAPLLKPGDIIIQRFEGWADKWFVPGFWNHAGIYVGGDKEQIVHAVSEGVLIEDIINYMRTDHLIILRSDDVTATLAVERAKQIVGAEYDFHFDFSDNKRFSCTEVIDYCFLGLIKKKTRFWRDVITPDDVVECPKLTKIWDSRDTVTSYKFRACGAKYPVLERSVDTK